MNEIKITVNKTGIFVADKDIGAGGRVTGMVRINEVSFGFSQHGNIEMAGTFEAVSVPKESLEKVMQAVIGLGNGEKAFLVTPVDLKEEGKNGD